MRRYGWLATVLVVAATGLLAGPVDAEPAVGATQLISASTTGGTGDDASRGQAISADGTRISYESTASNLVARDTGVYTGVYLYDSVTDSTTLVSVAIDGGPANAISILPAISADGTKIAYTSYASNLVVGGTSGFDIYLYDIATRTTTLVSMDPQGGSADSTSRNPSISGDGNRIAYESRASDLVVGDTNDAFDIFFYDVSTGVTTQVSKDPSGGPTDSGPNYGESSHASISVDGATIVYDSEAPNIVARDTNYFAGVFAYDIATDTNRLISRASDGGEANEHSWGPTVSADGSMIVYSSYASNMVAEDTNDAADVFLFDVATGVTALISQDPDGGPTNDLSFAPAISANGTRIVYSSYASNIVAGDTNNASDVLLFDVATGVTTLISHDPDGGPANGGSFAPAISAGGTHITYSSDASNLMAGDTNNTSDVFVTRANRSADDPFGDDDGSVFEGAIEWLASQGITKGCNPPTNDKFCPNDPVTRGQVAAFLVRALGYTDNGGGDLFVDDDASVFESDIDRLGTAGVTKGCNPPANDRYCPDALVTRGQMAALLVRALKYADAGDGNLFVDDDESVFEADIDRLGTAGVTRGCNPPTNDKFCPDAPVTRGQMAAFLHRALGG